MESLYLHLVSDKNDGELDILRDESEAYARKLMEAGAIVSAVRRILTVEVLC